VPAQIAERSGVLGWNFDYFDAVERRNRLELRDKGCDGCDLAILGRIAQAVWIVVGYAHSRLFYEQPLNGHELVVYV
jgi:hypothetical protein